MIKEIICAGFGGQGVLTVGSIIASAAMKSEQQVTWYPSYGSEMRGGTANCTVKIGDEEIASPYAKTIDILFAMSGPAIDKFEAKIKPGGMLLLNRSMIVGARNYRSDITVCPVDAMEIAEKVDAKNAVRGSNMVMLGAFCAKSGLYPCQEFSDMIDSYFADHGKKNPMNAVYFRAGFDA